jgi:hypothetical protein
MQNSTKEKLLKFPNLNLTEKDFAAFDCFARMTETAESLSEKGHGVVDEGSVSKIISYLENLSGADLLSVEKSIIDDILHSTGFTYNRETDEVVYETDCDKFRHEIDEKRNFLILTLRCLARRLSDKGKENIKSLTVSERQLFYHDVYRHFIEKKGVSPPDTPDGWFAQFMKILTADTHYRSLGLYVSDPRPFIRKARKYVRNND